MYFLFPTDSQSVTHKNTDESADGDGQDGADGLRIERQGNGTENYGQEDQHQGNIGHDIQQQGTAGDLEGTLSIGIDLAQLQESGENGNIAQQQQNRVGCEEGPEQFGFGSQDFHDHTQNANNDCHDAVDDNGTDGHTVFAPALGENGGHIAVLSSVAGGVVGAQRPGDHVAEQGDQEQHGNGADEQAAVLAAHDHKSFDQTGSGIHFICGDSGNDAEAAEHINSSDDQTADDDSEGDLLLGTVHFIGEGADHLEAQQGEDDDGDGGKAVHIEPGHEGGEAHVVGKAVLYHIVNTHAAHQKGQAYLDHSADIQNNNAVTVRYYLQRLLMASLRKLLQQ